MNKYDIVALVLEKVNDISDLDERLFRALELLEEYNEEDSDSEEVLEVSLKKETMTREEDVTENIGKILSAAVDLRWEAEYDCSKKETIVCRVPCAEIINELELSQQQYDGCFYDSSGDLIVFDSSLTNQKAGLIIRKDYLDVIIRHDGEEVVYVRTPIYIK